MKKLLLLFLAMVGMLSTVSATDYMLGCNNGGDWYKGTDFSKNEDGTYTALMVLPSNNTSFMFTIFGGDSFSKDDWSNALYAFSGSGEGNKEVYGSGNETTTLYANGHGVLTFPRSSKARVLKIDFNSETKQCSITRMIVVASGYNSWSQTTDYLYATEEGSEIYTGKVKLEVDSSDKEQANGYKFVFLNNGNVYWGTNKGNGYIGDGYTENDNWVAYNNATVAVDGVYNLTANLSTWAWTDPELVNVTASVGTYGMATLCSEYALDFTGITDVKAYTINGYNNTDGTLTTSQVTGKVKAGTGLYIEGVANASVEVPTTIHTESASTNWLVGVTSEKRIYQIDGANTNYILTVNKKVGGNVDTPKFFKVYDDGDENVNEEDEDGNIVPAGKAYLQIPTVNPAREFFWFEGATSIESVKQNQTMNGEVYNLAGQRVAQPTNGLYIVNGKKVIMK